MDKFRKAYRERYFEKHKERIRARNREYQRKWRREHPEAVKVSLEAYRRRNLERADPERLQALRAFRQGLGMSQGEFGAAVGVSRAAVANWEHGRAPMNVGKLVKAFPELEGAAWLYA